MEEQKVNLKKENSGRNTLTGVRGLRGKQLTIRLSDEDVEFFKDLGDGNVSQGVRWAAERLRWYFKEAM